MTVRVHNQRAKISAILFLLALDIYLIFGIINTSLYANAIAGIYNYALLLSIAILALRELYQQKIRIRRIIAFFVTAFLIGISVFLREGGASKSILTIIVFTIAASSMDFEMIAKNSFFVILGMLIFIILSSQLGVINDFVYVMAGKPRHYLGFLYTLQPAGLMLELVILYLYTHRQDNRKRGIIPLMAFAVVIFYYTRARLTLFLEVMMFVYDYVYRKWPKYIRTKILQILEWSSFVLVSLCSIYLTLTYKSTSWKRALNLILAKRLEYGYNSIMKYGISAFGKNLSWAGMGLNKSGALTLEDVWVGYDWVDNAYIQTLQLYGLIFSIMVICIITASIYFLIKRKKYYLGFIFLIYAMYGFIDTAMLTLFYNVFWMVLMTEIVKPSSYHECLFERKNPEKRKAAKLI